MLGLRTIKQGDKVMVWSKSGRAEIVDGPRRMLLIGQTVEPLRRVSATPSQYLVVRFKDGRKEHVRGPASVWFDPIQHDAIAVEEAIAIDGNEALVVYRQDAQTVARRVVKGPELFVPQANEWLHQFSWHGTAPVAAGVGGTRGGTAGGVIHRKIPSALKFFKLRVIPDQLYFDVEDVRTADDALLLVKLMLFFELTDFDVMLDQTHDPIADFINAVNADIVDFVAAHTFDAFKEQTERLNDLATYPQLAQRAERIGYRINKVIYRGYHASEKLQTMHDDAIEMRTKLRLEAETENQAQTLADLKLQRETVRSVQRRELETEDAAHANHMLKLKHDELLRQRESDREQELKTKRLSYELETEHQRALNGERAAFLTTMKTMQVDLTKYLVAQYQNPDRVIRVDSNGNGKTPPQLHLHE